MGTVILGGGIIGTSIAFYLSQLVDDASSIHIVESSERLFSSASGYGAGFIAKDWFPRATTELGGLSFDLHRQLAAEHGGDEKWGYTPSIALSLAFSEDLSGGKGERGEDWLLCGTSRAAVSVGQSALMESNRPVWLTKQKGDDIDIISSEEGCAQVDPLRLCHFLMNECRAKGVVLHQPAMASSVEQVENGTLRVQLVSSHSAVLDKIDCKHLVIATGAWTPAVFKDLFPSSTIDVPITSLAGYSLLLNSPRHNVEQEAQYGTGHAIFAPPGSRYSWAPEIFSRQGGEIYIAGFNEANLPLPQEALGVTLEPESIAEVKRVAVEMMGLAGTAPDGRRIDDLEITREALCFRPVTAKGTPIVTKLHGSSLGNGFDLGEQGGVLIAAGHGPWYVALESHMECFVNTFN